MIRFIVFSLIFTSMAFAVLSASGRAQEEKTKLTIDDMRELHNELTALRGKLEVYFNEISAMQEEFMTADEDRKKEIESQHMLKERAYTRMSESIFQKAAQIVDGTTELIGKGDKSPDLRLMRIKSAYDVKRYDLVVEDAPFVPEEEQDLHYQTILAHSLAGVYRFKEACTWYEKTLLGMKENEKPYIMDRLAGCYMNAHQFAKAQKLYADLAEMAPAAQKQQYAKQSMNATQHVKIWEREAVLRDEESKKGTNPVVVLQVAQGEIELELFEDQAPNTVANFITLVESGFYDGLLFHRVIPQFMVQAGCPENTGNGGPGYSFADECRQANARRHFVGSLSMANSGVNTNGSQFFLSTVVTWWLDGKHTVFGRVLKGQDVVNRTVQGDRIISAAVMQKRDHEYKVNKL